MFLERNKNLMKHRHIQGIEITLFVIVSLMAFAGVISAGCGNALTPAAEAIGDPPWSGVAAQDDYDKHIPVLDTDYDDRWVANVPDVIGGYRVLYISTPKNTACNSTPVIGLRARQKSMDEFLRDSPGPEVDSIVDSIPGVPPDVRLSFSYSQTPHDKEEHDARSREWNASNIDRGYCIRSSRVSGLVHIEFVDPDLPTSTVMEIDDD